MKAYIKIIFLSFLFFCLLGFWNINLKLNPCYFNGSSLNNNIFETFSVDIDSSKSRAISITKNNVLASATNGTSVFSSMPKTIVNTVHDISGNSGRKIVLLENGWLVAVTKYSNSGYLYISKDNGITWSQLCTITSGFYGSYSITSYGTKIYVIGNTSAIIEKVWVIDAATQTNVNIESAGVTIDSAQSGFGLGCAITADDNGVLHAVWSSKNSTFPNSFNLRYSKSEDFGQTWSASVQLTNINSTSGNLVNPSILTRNNNPVIICEGNGITASEQSIILGTNAQSIVAASFEDTTMRWNFYNVYSITSYSQDYPSMCITSDGNIHVAWHGRDNVDPSVDNIKYSSSSDGGVAWSEPVKVTSGNSYPQQYPSVTCDKDNNKYIYFQGRKNTNYFNIWKVGCLSDAWSSPIQITNNTTSHTYYPQTVFGRGLNLYKDEPLVMWQDNQAASIFFSGKLPEWYNNEVQGTVAEGAYKISGYSGKKIMKLKDGILISAIQDTVNHKVMFYKSKDNGVTWALIKEDIPTTSVQDIVLTELDDGSFGYLLLSNSKYVSFKKVNKDNYETIHQIDISNQQSNVGTCSIALGNDGVLHAVWSGYSSSSNIWYSKSSDGGITWNSPVPLSATGNNTFSPFIVINKDNKPIVLFSYRVTEYYDDGAGGTNTEYLYYLSYLNNIDGTWTSRKTIPANTSYIQQPTAIVDTNGALHCVWNAGNSLIYTNSTDGGNTWSASAVISGGKYFKNPSLCNNKDNEIFVLGSSNAIGSIMNIGMFKRDINGVWSNISILTNNTTTAADFPQIVQNSAQDFQVPEFMYLDNQAKSIIFQSILNDILPFAKIISPVSDEAFSLNKTVMELKIKIRDENNKTLECKYYLDNETESREVISVSDTCVTKEVSFTHVDITTLSQGEHRIKVKVSNQLKTFEITGVFYVDKEQPVIGTNTSSTDTSITVYASGADTGNLSSVPYRYSIGELSGEWTTEASYTWDNLKPDTLYNVAFEAKDGAGNISCNKKDIYTKSQVPEISLNNITSQSMDINITDNNPETTLYQINVGRKYVDESGKLTDIPEWIIIAGKKLIISGLTPNSKYVFTVKTKNRENEESQYSMPLEAETLGITLSMPLNISINTSFTYTLITWNSVEGAIEYEVEADGLIMVVKTPIFKHTGLVPNTQHTYRIRAKNYYGYSDWSAIETALTGSSMPVGMTNINVFPSNTAVVLTWNAIEDAQGYEVEFDGKVIDNGLNTFCTKSGLHPESSHTYRVRAINASGEGTWSEVGSVTTYLLDTPSSFEIVEDEAEVKLVWSAVDKAVEYEIEVNDSTLLITSDHAYIHTGLTPETTYMYRIKARNSNGESSWSDIIYATTLPVRPDISLNITAHSIQNIITITWDGVDGAIAYDVELDGVLVDNGSSTTYVHEDLSSFTLHTYRIRAKNEAVEGKWSKLLNIKTMEGKPKYPGRIMVDSTTTITTLSWESQNDALAYDVEVDGKIIENVTKPTYTHRRIAPGTEHLYRIRTRNITGTSLWSGYIINNALRAVCKKDKDLDLGLTASDIIDFSKYTLKVTYNPDVIEVMDLSTLSSKIELKEGIIEGTGIKIISFKAGEIVFIVDKSIPPGESWSGVINSIKFRAKVSGGTNITYTVYGTPEDIQ